MFAPTRIWRRWHRKVNLNQKRYAVASAVAASAIPALVLARGHQISQVPEIPLVIDTAAVETLTKTKNALALLTNFKANADIERCKNVTRRTGKARLRNRAKKIKAGPLIVVGNKGTTTQRAFRNLSGVQVANVTALNLLVLAPGGHLGRFIIWTRDAFEQLNTVFGTADKPSTVKRGYFLPRPVLSNPDVRRIIQSDSVQALVGPKPARFVSVKRINFLKHHNAMRRINPYSPHTRGTSTSLARSGAEAKKKGSTLKRDVRKLGKNKAIRKIRRGLYAKYRKMVRN